MVRHRDPQGWLVSEARVELSSYDPGPGRVWFIVELWSPSQCGVGACQARSCTAEHAVHLRAPFPRRVRPAGAILHLTLKVFIFMPFPKQSERLSREQGGVIEPPEFITLQAGPGC